MNGTAFFLLLVRVGLVTGIVDALFSSALAAFFYRSTVSRLWQGVASVPLGPAALDGGMRTVAIGLLIHFGVAFGWSAVFLLLALSASWIRGALASPSGVAALAVVYGPLIWMVMTLGLVPLLTHRPPTINARWWIQFAGHIPFVALPIVATVARMSSRSFRL